MNIICYASLEEEEFHNLKNEIKGDAVHFEIETDFANIIVKAKNHELDVLLLSYHDYIKNPMAMNIFRENTVFYVPLVLVAGRGRAIPPDMPDNYHYLDYSALANSLGIIRQRMIFTRKQEREFVRKDIIQTAQQTLLDLGFNGCTFGTNFIRDCILGVMDIDCQPESLNKTIYAQVSQKNNTTLANLLRCTRASLESAWKRRKKNTKRLDCGVCFDDFSLCPSVKEFIYYVAYKLNSYIHTNNHRKYQYI